MGKCFLDPAVLLEVAELLTDIANFEPKCTEKRKSTRRNQPCGCGCHGKQPRDEFGRFASRNAKPCCGKQFHDEWKNILCDEFGHFESGRVGRPVCPPPAPRWGVCECEPREDENKVFGVNIRVDEPTPDMFCTRARFLDARRKWDNLVDAVEAVDWENKSNTAPLHKVNCIRKRIEEGPVFGLNLIGESRWFE